MNNAQLAKMIKITCKEKKIPVNKLLSECDIRKSLIYDLEKRDYTPSVAIIEQIADYLECSVDYLLGRTDTPNIETNNIFKPSLSHSNFGTVNGNVTGNISNAMGESITINNSESDAPEISNEYEYMIALLNSLDKRDRRHAIVEIECMLEDDYKLKKNNE